LSVHTIGANQFHTRETPIRRLEDLKGLRIRVPTPLAGRMVTALGAVPVELPGPRVYQALVNRDLDGAVMTWDFLGSSKAYEVVRYHTETDDALPMIGTTVIVFAMNRDRYATLPADLRGVIDANSGAALAHWVAGVLGAAEGPWRELVGKNGNTVTPVQRSEIDRWRRATRPVIDEWVSQMQTQGLDGAGLVRELEAMRY
jgi:TRAP-type C4-dicarboxylate transport system substrate-binding protein